MVLRNYPDFIKSFLHFSSSVPAPGKFLKWAALSIVAGALERKVWIRNAGYLLHPNLYIMLVGDPGISRKSTSSQTAMKILRKVPDMYFLSTQVTSASMILAMRESGLNRYVKLNGLSYYNSSSFLYSSEAAVTLKEIQGSIIELLTDFYDCQPNGWNTGEETPWEKRTKSDGPIRIFNPCLNMLACSTPNYLKYKNSQQVYLQIP